MKIMGGGTLLSPLTQFEEKEEKSNSKIIRECLQLSSPEVYEQNIAFNLI